MTAVVDLDDRRRLSLGKIGRHTRYLVREESDGTLIWEPAIVLTEFEAKVLANPAVVAQLKASQDDPSRLKPRERHRPARPA